MIELETGQNGMCKCTGCKSSIPKDVPRISLGYRTQYGMSWFRLCGICLIKLGHMCDSKKHKKAIDAWARQLTAEAI